MTRTAAQPPNATARSNKTGQRLIGAHGLFWSRDETDWEASRGRTFQMLGMRGDRSPTFEICDFRKAHGVYVLYNDYGPTYVGRARGKEGFGTRLKMHNSDPEKDWSRFSWFAFHQVKAWQGKAHWRECVAHPGVGSLGAEPAIDDLEALMIVAFGTKQRRMGLGGGERWNQVTYQHCGPHGRIKKLLDLSPIRDTELREALALNAH